MACMAVQRFHQGQHGIKVVGADGEVELRYDSVCYVFLWNMARRGQSGTVQQGTHDVFLWLTAPFASRQQGFQRAQQGDNAYDAEDIDGNTGYGAFHLVTVNGGGSSEYTGKVEVEYLFCSWVSFMLMLLTEAVMASSTSFHCAPIPGNGSHSLYPLR